LLLLPGQAADHSMWNRLAPLLAERHRVIAVDQRGTGASDHPTSEPYSTRALAGDAVAVLDDAGLTRAHVFGYSMGGRVAQWVALDHPDRVGALVLGATSAGDQHGEPRDPELTAMLAAPQSLSSARRWVSVMWHPSWVAKAALSGALPSAAEISPEVRELQRRASAEHDTLDRLGEIRAATLVVHGSDDALTPSGNARLLVEAIPGAELHLVAGGRHGFVDEYREQTARVVLDFLDRHPL
jgi:pimeloyl-ACP methyl ester carboxylesterase